MYVTSSQGIPGGSVVKNLPASSGDTGDLGLIPGLGRSSGREMTTISIILAWEIPGTEELGRLQSMGLQKRWTRFSD